MSTSVAVDLRLGYLDQAAQVLSRTSPSISGHLRSAQHRLATGEGREVSTLSQLQICPACGSSLILGWNCEKATSKVAGKKRTRQDRLRKHDSPKAIDVRCSRCEKVTKLEMVRIPKAKERKPQVELPAKLPSVLLPAAPPPEIARSPSSGVLPSGTASVASAVKKRSRNKKSSLLSMLENRKPASQTPGFGLGLADFMK